MTLFNISYDRQSGTTALLGVSGVISHNIIAESSFCRPGKERTGRFNFFEK